MFTGIVETTGTVLELTPARGGRKLCIDAGEVASDAAEGASIAVNGVCLTVTRAEGERLVFDVIEETIARSNLARLSPRDKVNLERALRADGRIDGHFVQGHVDCIGKVTRCDSSARECLLWIRADEEAAPSIVPKGSVAIDGVSLTIAAVEGSEFSVALIPTTLERTTLSNRRVGDAVNIETDIITRTIVHYLRRQSSAGGISMETLREHGYL